MATEDMKNVKNKISQFNILAECAMVCVSLIISVCLDLKCTVAYIVYNSSKLSDVPSNASTFPNMRFASP